MKIDNTTLESFQTCPSLYFLRHKESWVPRSKSAALGFGGAIHLGLAEWYKTSSLDDALNAIEVGWPEGLPVDDYRTLDKAQKVMREYVDNYPHESWQVVQGGSGPLIEVPFLLNTGMYLDCRCGRVWSSEDGITTCPYCHILHEPLEYGGIFDGMIKHGGQLWTLEHKSTSVMGPLWSAQFHPNNQVTGYIWAAQEMSGQKLAGAYINGIGIYKTGKTKFERLPTARMPQEIDEWKRNVLATCNEIRKCELSGVFPMKTKACTLYGLCMYHEVHSLPLPEDRLRMLKAKYMVEPWDFENRDK